MPVSLVNEVWSELKRYINTVDRDEASETVVSILIDNDVSAEEILTAFKGDSDIRNALAEYIEDTEVEDNDDSWDDFSEDEDEEDY